MRFEVTSIKPYVGELKGPVQQDGSIVEGDRIALKPDVQPNRLRVAAGRRSLSLTTL